MLIVFFVLVGLTASTRIIEILISRRHRRKLFEHGAVAIIDPEFKMMVALHTGILASSIVEVLVVRRPPVLWISVAAAAAVLLASLLRVWAIRSLGEHWNVQVVDSTKLGVISSGPYRWIRHPNYVAVFAELAFLPLVQGAWVTALVGSTLHFFVLRHRIRLEETMLMKDHNYRATMARKPRFLPVS